MAKADPRAELTFESPDEELRFLRGLLSVQRLADEVLEDCLALNLSLSAALDVYLSQCARMVHAVGGFVQLRGSQEPVVERSWGERFDHDAWTTYEGAVVVSPRRTVFVAQLDLGDLNFGCLAFLLPGAFEGGGKLVMALVKSVAEMLDSTVLGFLALGAGHTVQSRLDELSERLLFRPRGRLGKYELVTPLGTGGMAQVMVARTVGPAGVTRLVALKRILPHLAQDQAMVEQFLDEAKLGLKLSHPNLVTFHDFGQVASGYFIAMELLRGVDFDHIIYATPGKVSPEIASAVLVQALEGLHHAHELKGDDGKPVGLVHRDLSPHNLHVGFDGQVKVLDFGVAKMRNQRTVTLPGVVKGKPVYMSPEQATAERVDRRTDVFAAGLVLFEAVVGHRAFDKGNDTSSMLAIVNDALERPPGLSDVVWEIIATATSKKPNDRFRSAKEMAEVLKERIPPASAHEVGQLVTDRFPRQLEEFARWEKVAQEWSHPTQGVRGL